MTDYPGTCVVTRLEDGLLRVDRADPLIWVSAELLRAVNEPCSAPHADGKPSPCFCGNASYGDGILTIRAVNGTVSYGVGKPASTTEEAFIAYRSGGGT